MKLSFLLAFLIPAFLFVVLIFVYAFKSRIADSLFNILVYAFIIISAWGLSSEKYRTKQDLRLSQYSGQVLGELLQEPSLGANSVKLVLAAEALSVDNEWYSTTGKLQIYLPIEERALLLEPGDKIIFSPDLKEFENQGNPQEFDYKKYMWQQYITLTDYLQSEDWQKLESHKGNPIERYAARLRNYVIDIYEASGLKDNELAVATALTLGNKSYLSDEIRQAYSISGGMHVLAVSGLHVGVFYIVISWLLAFIKSKRLEIPKTIFIILAIWFYACLTGLAPSVVRAATMFSLFAIGRIARKDSNSINILAASAFLALIINPASLFQIGFMLSHIAVFSIVYFYPKIYALWIPKFKILEKLWSLIAVSTAAQIGTIPITIFYFNQFPTYFLLTNMLLIPMVSVAIYLGVALIALSFIPYVSTALAWLFSKSITIMNFSVQWIESLPSASIQALYINQFQFILLLILMLSIILLIETRAFKYFAGSLVIILFFAFSSLFQNYKAMQQTNFVVYNLRNTTAINLIDAKSNVLFYKIYNDKTQKFDESLGSYWASIKTNKANEINLDDLRPELLLSNIVKISNNHVFAKSGFFGFYNFRFFIPDSRHNNISNFDNKIKLNCVVYTDNCRLSLGELLSFTEFDKLIVDASLSRFRLNQIEEDAENYDLDIFYTNKMGAYLQSDLRKL
ncbi:MAG: ComEC family competence protein [Bacteroidales bacterium]|nr:ComEC family competence protein [Bacteroidales bacterium]